MHYRRANLRFERELIETFSRRPTRWCSCRRSSTCRPGVGARALPRAGRARAARSTCRPPTCSRSRRRGPRARTTHGTCTITASHEFEQLCREHFASVALFGLYHARKLRAHELALGGWDHGYPRLGLTERFYGWFTPAISTADFALRPRGQADLDGRWTSCSRSAGRERLASDLSTSRPVSVPYGAAPRRKPRGELAIVLHTHMPYVRASGRGRSGRSGCGRRSPAATCRCWSARARGAADGVADARCSVTSSRLPGWRALRSICRRTSAATPSRGSPGLRAGATNPRARGGTSWRDYERAGWASSVAAATCSGTVAPYAQWTSAATHAVLPLLASEAGAAAGASGVESHAARFALPTTLPRAGWRGGFWLPECAHAGQLEPTARRRRCARRLCGAHPPVRAWLARPPAAADGPAWC